MRKLFMLIILILALSPIGYFALRDAHEYSISGPITYSPEEPKAEHVFFVNVYQNRWIPVFFEYLMTPRFTVVVQNSGILIERGGVYMVYGNLGKVSPPFSIIEFKVLVALFIASAAILVPPDSSRFNLDRLCKILNN